MKKIKYFFTDCDGVLTDGGLYYSNKGQVMKKFNSKDGMGLNALQQIGIKVGIITGDDHKLIKQRAKDLGLDYLIMNCHDKLSAIHMLDIDPEEIAYIGDDVNDLELLENVQFKACPRDSVRKILNIDGITICEKKGGEGCVREFIDNIINSLT